MDIAAHEMKRALDIVKREDRTRTELKAGAPSEICAMTGVKTWCPWRLIVAADKGGEGAVEGVTGWWKALPVSDTAYHDERFHGKGHYCSRDQERAFLSRAGSGNIG